MTRSIVVFSTKLGKKTKINTNAADWGEFKEELVKKGIFNAGTMKAIDKDSRQSLEIASASIYDGMTVYLLPTKNESGVDISEDDFEEFVEKLNNLVDEFRESLNEAADDVKDNADNSELMNDALDIADELRRV